MEWKEIVIAAVSFLSGLIFDLIRKVLPTYIDLSKENHDLREKIRELESELEDERDLREKDKDSKVINSREVKAAMDALVQRRRRDDPKDDVEGV